MLLGERALGDDGRLRLALAPPIPPTPVAGVPPASTFVGELTDAPLDAEYKYMYLLESPYEIQIHVFSLASGELSIHRATRSYS